MVACNEEPFSRHAKVGEEVKPMRTGSERRPQLASMCSGTVAYETMDGRTR